MKSANWSCTKARLVSVSWSSWACAAASSARVAVAEVERGVAGQQVEEAAAVDVGHPGALGVRDDHRQRVVVVRGARLGALELARPAGRTLRRLVLVAVIGVASSVVTDCLTIWYAVSVAGRRGWCRRRARERDGAAVGADDRLHQRQPETDAAGALPGRVAAGEPLEGVVDEVGREARPVVVDVEPVRVVRHRHRGAGRGVLAGVGQQVGDHLVQPLLVADDLDGGASGQVQAPPVVRARAPGRPRPPRAAAG